MIDWWEKFWEKPELQSETAKILKRFVEETGKTAFYYSDVRRWYYGTGAFEEYGKDWHTIERLMRKLAELGYVARYRVGRTVLFVLIPFDSTKHAIDHYRAEYERAHALGDARWINEIAKALAVELNIDVDTARDVLRGQEVLEKWLQ